MNNFSEILNIFNDNVAIGKSIEINNITLIPIFKVNVNYMLHNSKEDLKDKESSNANISVTPLCLLQVIDNKVSLVTLNHKGEFMSKVPGILESLNDTFKLTDILKS